MDPSGDKAGSQQKFIDFEPGTAACGIDLDSAAARKNMTNTWTEDRVATLTKLWADGLSASQIAAELGGVTRNAVIGKVHRLGLSGRAKPTGSGIKRVKRAKSSYNAKPRATGRAGLALRDTGSNSVRTIVQDLEEPTCQKLDLVQLTESTCKWPHGDPATNDFHFCGNKTKEDTPYCEYHCRLAYQPQAERRRDRQRAAAAR